MRINTSLASLALCCVCSLSGAASPLMGSVVQPGEELQYKVKYGFVRLGTVVVKTEQDPYSHDPNMVRVTFTMDTDPKIPFLNVHEYSESTMNRWRLTSERFYGEHLRKGHKIRVRFQYDEPHKFVWWDRTDLATGSTLNHDTIRDMQPFLEGPSLFTYGRAMSASHDIVTRRRTTSSRCPFSSTAPSARRSSITPRGGRTSMSTRSTSTCARASTREKRTLPCPRQP